MTPPAMTGLEEWSSPARSREIAITQETEFGLLQCCGGTFENSRESTVDGLGSWMVAGLASVVGDESIVDSPPWTCDQRRKTYDYLQD